MWFYCTGPGRWQQQNLLDHLLLYEIHWGMNTVTLTLVHSAGVIVTCERADMGVSLSIRSQPLIPSLKMVTVCHCPTTIRLSLTIWAAPVPQLNLKDRRPKNPTGKKNNKHQSIGIGLRIDSRDMPQYQCFRLTNLCQTTFATLQLIFHFYNILDLSDLPCWKAKERE